MTASFSQQGRCIKTVNMSWEWETIDGKSQSYKQDKRACHLSRPTDAKYA